MAFLSLENISVDGIAVCVPPHKAGYDDFSHLFTPEEYERFVETTGITGGRMPAPGVCTSDLCCQAAEKLFESIGVDRSQIDLLIFVSQTPDYIVPMTSCLLQQRLGLTEECMAFDSPLGCSGYVYGLGMAGSILASGNIRRALLLAGDCSTTQNSRLDRTTYPIFGAAGSATLLSFNKGSAGLKLHLATDGSGAESIMIKAGGQRHPVTADSLVVREVEPGIVRSDAHTAMNGLDVFSFAMSQAPETIEKLYGRFGLDMESTDYFVFHQANKLILDTIGEVLDIPTEKMPLSLAGYANTSSASIPLTIASQLGPISRPVNMCLCGFGVGLSWGSCYMETQRLHCELIEYV